MVVNESQCFSAYPYYCRRYAPFFHSGNRVIYWSRTRFRQDC